MKFEVTVEFKKDFFLMNENKIVIGIASRPEKGRANVELIKKLAGHFNVSSSQVRILSGIKSRRKIVEIQF